jgi:hypothetical protein
MDMTMAAIGELLEKLKRMCDDLEVTHRGTQWRVYVYINGVGAQTIKTLPDVTPRDDTAENLLDCLADAHDWLTRRKQ